MLFFNFFKGNGGDSGTLKVLVSEVDGNVELRACRGNGAVAATNGRGGLGTKDVGYSLYHSVSIGLYLTISFLYFIGGLGSYGGHGRLCQSNRFEPGVTIAKCLDKGQGSQAARGPRGNKGTTGNSKRTKQTNKRQFNLYPRKLSIFFNCLVCIEYCIVYDVHKYRGTCKIIRLQPFKK